MRGDDIDWVVDLGENMGMNRNLIGVATLVGTLGAEITDASGVARRRSQLTDSDVLYTVRQIQALSPRCSEGGVLPIDGHLQGKPH